MSFLKRFRLPISLAALCVALTLYAQGLEMESRYSPLNNRRETRRATEFIVLHTTEGAAIGSLEKLRRYGEAHYMIDTKGKVYRIIERHRVAFHAGRSMWMGKTNLDNISIGIEMVGYHDKPLTAAQTRALRELLRQLKSIYKVPDTRILPHSMVAYGSPNRWHRVSHRGRKRCAMLMATDSVRHSLGLNARPSHDPDVRAKRLVVADPHLHAILFAAARPAPRPADPRPQPTVPPPTLPTSAEGGNIIARGRSAWDIARERYNSPSTIYTFPDGKVLRGNEVRNWNQLPAGTRVQSEGEVAETETEIERVQIIGKDGNTPSDIAGEAVREASTIYFLTDGRVLRGTELSAEQALSLPDGTGMLVGYVYGGVINAKRRAFDICGPRWNLPTTFYRLADGSIRSGDAMNERNIPNQTQVFFQP